MSKQYEDQPDLDNIHPPMKKKGPIECLGMEFENDEARREYFLNILRDKLRDPEFRKIDGFPIGEDEDILALSDPPYYTACPNPFIEDFIKYYGKPYDPGEPYNCEPLAADARFGKTSNTITRAHPYHTKVPPDAIARFADYYLGKSGILLDCFCGIGMSGVGVNLHNNENGSDVATVLCDLSPLSTFVSYNYNSKVDYEELENDLRAICDELEERTRDYYKTSHNGWPSKPRQTDIFARKNSKTFNGNGIIQYIVLSEEVACPNCGEPNTVWNSRNIDVDEGKALDEFLCSKCGVHITKKESERIWETRPDPCIKGRIWKIFRQRPVLIYYDFGGKMFCKKPDKSDIDNFDSFWELSYPYIPISTIPEGDKTGELISGNTLYFHQCYHPFTLFALNELFRILEREKESKNIRRIKFAVSPLFSSLTRMAVIHLKHFFKGGGGHFVSNISGFLHFPSISFVRNAASALDYRIRSVVKSEELKHDRWGDKTVVSCQSSTSLSQIQNDSIDYVFIDPPFGENLMYSELNFFWETCLGIRTNISHEAIINKTQNKKLRDYQLLMTKILDEVCRVLKPGRWLTVEFHNTKNAVWSAIQESIEHAGFIVADVRILDKKLGSYNQNVSMGSAKSDLIISAYKPNSGLEESFRLKSGTEEGVWDFVRTHLKQLPVFTVKGESIEVIAERENFLLFDRMVAFHVQRGVTVPLSASEFYSGLVQRFPERDGMYLLSEQIAEYDRKRMTVKEILQLKLFVSDEESSIQWLRQQLTKKTQTFQDIHPDFLREIRKWKRHEKPLELMELLRQNFLRYDGNGDVPSQIHSYLSTNFKDLRNLPKDDPTLRAKAKDRWYVPDPSKAGDLEKLRERSLLREFREYRESKQKRLKIFRLEAVRTGFKKAWQERDYQTIIEVARKIPDNILHEDQKLLMWYDQALTRTGED